MNGQKIFPGVNTIEDEAFFRAHLATPTGRAEIERGDWVFVTSKGTESESAPSVEALFENMPATKQKELINDTYNVEILEGFISSPKISLAIRKLADAKIADLKADIMKKKDKTEDDSE